MLVLWSQTKWCRAVPYLIESGSNGYAVNNKIDMYVECIRRIIADNELREKMALKAYKTVHEIWSPENAAQQLIYLLKKLISNELNDIIDGPCSNA